MTKRQDDATKVAGLASILKAGNKEKEIPPSPAPVSASPKIEEMPPPAPRSSSERVGKSRDPNYHQCGLYIRKDTHKRAKRALEDLESGQDLSELVESLLEQWLASRPT